MREMGDSKFQFLPPLSEEEREALRLDILARGIQQPVEKDEEGNILDGHNRQDLADELGVPCPSVVLTFPNDEEKAAYALRVNLARRQLSPEQWRAVRAKQREIARQLDAKGYDQGQIAAIMGVTQQLVSYWLGVESATNVCSTFKPYKVRIKTKVPPAEWRTLHRDRCNRGTTGIVACLAKPPTTTSSSLARS
jgi:hypothetical protein